MFTLNVEPRFCETDALGHINNTTLPVWFEQAREPLFRVFVPSMKPRDWNLIIARIEVDFLAQLEFGDPVEIRTWLSRIGSSSMEITQEAWQCGACGARGKAVMIHFDYKQGRPAPIPETVRPQLSDWLKPEDQSS